MKKLHTGRPASFQRDLLRSNVKLSSERADKVFPWLGMVGGVRVVPHALSKVWTTKVRLQVVLTKRITLDPLLLILSTDLFNLKIRTFQVLGYTPRILNLKLHGDRLLKRGQSDMSDSSVQEQY